MFRTLTISAFAAAAVAAATPAFAQVAVGVLECKGGPSGSYIIGSTTSLDCVFKPNGGKAEGYKATVRKVGLDIGFTGQSAMAWMVFAPTSKVGKGALSGNYGGISAGAAVGVGGGANLLVGGSDKSFTLQPVSLQGQTGVNVAAAVTSLELRAAAPSRAARPSSKKKRDYPSHAGMTRIPLHVALFVWDAFATIGL